MTTTVAVTTIYEGNNIIVKRITAVGDETAAEQSVIDLSTLAGPQSRYGEAVAPGMASLMEASWNINSVFESAKLYWHDETNDSIILSMSGDSSISFEGVGGLHYGVEAEAGDGDVLVDLTNAGEAASGSVDITLVFKKKE